MVGLTLSLSSGRNAARPATARICFPSLFPSAQDQKARHFRTRTPGMRTEAEFAEPLLLEPEKAPEAGVSEQEEDEEIPPWRDHIMVRGLLVSALLGALFCIITHKLNLTMGVIPSLNVVAGLLEFFFIKTWTGFLQRIEVWTKPFTRQENTVIQTCVDACYGLAFSGQKMLKILPWDG